MVKIDFRIFDFFKGKPTFRSIFSLIYCMGIGQQTNFFKIKSQQRYSYGGVLRNKKLGRGQRPLSTRDPIHVVFKINKVLYPQLQAGTYTPTATNRKLKRRKSLWRYRPFSRVVKGYRAYVIVRDYIQLNEQEILGKISYQKNRLRGLSSSDWTILWT